MFFSRRLEPIGAKLTTAESSSQARELLRRMTLMWRKCTLLLHASK